MIPTIVCSRLQLIKYVKELYKLDLRAAKRIVDLSIEMATSIIGNTEEADIFDILNNIATITELFKKFERFYKEIRGCSYYSDIDANNFFFENLI